MGVERCMFVYLTLSLSKARRNRLLVIGVHDSHGGPKGADAVVQCLKDILALRRGLPPACVWQLVDPDSVEEIAIRERDVMAKQAADKVRSLMLHNDQSPMFCWSFVFGWLQ